MAMNAPSMRERKAAAAARLLSAVPTEEIMGDLVDTVHDRIDNIRPNPHQPRQGVDEESQEFHDLVGSIRQQGLIQPISLWQQGDGDYTIIAGERRWRAFRRLYNEKPADFARIPATVTRLLGDNPEAAALMRGIIENVVRQDLRDGERADALARLKATTNWTWKEIGERMGLDVYRVQALASIARHDAVKEAVNEGRITQKQALAIAQGVPAEETELATELVGAVENLTPQEARSLVREAKAAPADLPAPERVQHARGKVFIGTQPVERTENFDIRDHGKLVRRAETQIVMIGSTSLRVIRPRVGEMERTDFAEMLQRVCEETGVWPTRPGE
jgi:ParB/RepB/Spo0J family partition protein